MATLYVEKVPEELYQSLRERAQTNHRSIAAETISLLESVLPSPQELRRRAAFYQRIQRLTARMTAAAAGPSTEEMLREDRAR
ncbi:MAG TPA: Arc family DNA-binding protein [Bryobacteraceae bacterium]|nr:Arc family DNA-binding protein [Bryobacteraceae bacterium]